MPQKRTIRSTKSVYNTKDIQTKVNEIADRLNADYADQELILVAVLTGSLVFTADLLRRLKGPSRVWVEIVKVVPPKSPAEGGALRLDLLPDSDWLKSPVLVIGDVVDSGLTLNTVVDGLRAKGVPLKNIAAAVLVQKQHQGPAPRVLTVAPRYVAFDNEPRRRLVGYGMDFEGIHRNKPDIHEHLY